MTTSPYFIDYKGRGGLGYLPPIFWRRLVLY